MTNELFSNIMLTEINIFEKGEKFVISKALEEYLKTMYVLKKQNGNIRVTDIAEKMNCSKPSVNKAINILKSEDLINYETYGAIEMTEKRKSGLLERF